jgi:hypothetical protein
MIVAGTAWRAVSTARCLLWFVKNKSVPITRASARSWAKLAKASSISRSVLACKILSFNPRLRAAVNGCPQNAPGTRMPCQAFTRKTKIIITSSWQSDCLSPQAFCHLAGHVLRSAKSGLPEIRQWFVVHPATKRMMPAATSRIASRPSPISAAIVVCRDKRNPEARHYCLLDRLIGSYLHADAGLDAMLGQEPLRQQARPGANLAHQNGLLGDLSRRDRTLLG